MIICEQTILTKHGEFDIQFDKPTITIDMLQKVKII